MSWICRREQCVLKDQKWECCSASVFADVSCEGTCASVSHFHVNFNFNCVSMYMNGGDEWDSYNVNVGKYCLVDNVNVVLWPMSHVAFVLNNILILGVWCSTIPHLPGCFCPWTFFENIGFNTVLTDPFMSHLTTQLGYSAGEFQALQLIVLAAFGVVD